MRTEIVPEVSLSPPAEASTISEESEKFRKKGKFNREAGEHTKPTLQRKNCNVCDAIEQSTVKS